MLTVTGLRKRYGSMVALDGIDFSVDAGEVLGLLGPNGAGKTTAVECIAGLLRPDGGEIVLDGAVIDRSTRGRIGIAPQGPSLPDAITPGEAMSLFARLYHVRADTDRLLGTAGLSGKRDARFSGLSGGEKQRLNLALALIHDPLLVLLDEPTAGLDPPARAALMNTIRRLADEGRAVLLTTHDLDEAERVCDRLAIVDHGRIIASGTPAELIAGGASLTVIEGEASVPFAPGDDEILQGMNVDGCRFRCRTDDPTGAVLLITQHIQRHRGALVSLRVGQARLEDVLLDLLERQGAA